eukprot:6191219-Pleurochrysis_carterae.AAC.1
MTFKGEARFLQHYPDFIGAGIGFHALDLALERLLILALRLQRLSHLQLRLDFQRLPLRRLQFAFGLDDIALVGLQGPGVLLQVEQ